MKYAEWFKKFSHKEVWPGLNANVVTGKQGQIGFFEASQDVEVPEHSHAGQWGCVFEGTVEFMIGGVYCVYTAGQTYNIPAGVAHSAKVHAGTKFVDVWEGKRLEVEE